ncbi:hypothetical protein [Burkholderia ubonensis]|uniref:hypothetical protein n=1 Tax=Burkholderia ubonensis TaxID=101571 RepID=UPI000AA1B21A|nr:hypothetical protein [Burkholderia ubonensis]
MGFLKWITGGHAQRGHHGGGHGSGHHERGRDPHGWGWQVPAAGGARFCPACGTQAA